MNVKAAQMSNWLGTEHWLVILSNYIHVSKVSGHIGTLNNRFVTEADGRNTQVSGDGRMTCEASGFVGLQKMILLAEKKPCENDFAEEHMLHVLLI